MFLITYEVETGNNYAGGTVERQTLVESLEEAFRYGNVTRVQEVAVLSEMSLEEFNGKQEEWNVNQMEVIRQRNIDEMKQRLAELEGE